MSSPDSSRDVGTLAGGGQPDAPHLPTSTLVEQQFHGAPEVGGAQDHVRTVQDGHRPIISDPDAQAGQRLPPVGTSPLRPVGRTRDPDHRRRLLRSGNDVDERGRQVRTSTCTLTSASPAAAGEAVLAVVGALVPALGLRPEVERVGPLARPASATPARDVEAVVREPRADAGQYVGASCAGVRVGTDGSRPEPAVVDGDVAVQGTTRAAIRTTSAAAPSATGDIWSSTTQLKVASDCYEQHSSDQEPVGRAGYGDHPGLPDG